MKAKLDKSDRILLDILQSNAGASINDLVDASALSVASVQRRLKKLRESKVIQREVAILDPRVIGQKITIIVHVELERERVDQVQAFKDMAQKEPHVQQCYYVTGEADFILICMAKDMDDFEQLTQRLFFQNSNIRRFRSSIVMNRTKVGLTVPLWFDEE